jgi:hypothetical protein
MEIKPIARSLKRRVAPDVAKNVVFTIYVAILTMCPWLKRGLIFTAIMTFIPITAFALFGSSHVSASSQ